MTSAPLAWASWCTSFARRQPGVLCQHLPAPRIVRLLGILAPWRAVFALAVRLVARNQLVFAIADQVRTAHGLQCVAQHRPVGRIVVAQERLVQASLVGFLDDGHRLALVADALERVAAGI